MNRIGLASLVLASLLSAACGETGSRTPVGGADMSVAFTGCDDGVKGPDEADVDCGGACSAKCTTGLACGKPADCESGFCLDARCAPPNQCSNLTLDGDESDVDCGGVCPRCGPSRACAKPADCQSGKCESGTCAALQAALSGARKVAIGESPMAVAAGDFDGDGKLDLAAASGSEDKLSIALGNGDGSFKPATSLDCPLVATPDTIAAGDLDGDGRADLVVTSMNEVRVFMSQTSTAGGALFKAPVVFTAGVEPTAPRIERLDADATPDLLTVDASYDFDASTYNLWVSPYPQTGSWRALRKVGAGDEAPLAPALADINDDGSLDLVVLAGDSIACAFGRGDGSFQPFLPSMTGTLAASHLAIGDLDGDFRLDVVIVDRQNDQLGVMLGAGDGTFARPIKVAAPNTPVAAVVADFDLDGLLDVATANYYNDTVSLYVGRGQGLIEPGPFANAGTSPTSLVGADINGDDKLDLVTANPDANQATVILNGGR